MAERDSHGLHHSQRTHTRTQAGTHAPRHAAASDVPRRDDVAHRTTTRLSCCLPAALVGCSNQAT